MNCKCDKFKLLIKDPNIYTCSKQTMNFLLFNLMTVFKSIIIKFN